MRAKSAYMFDTFRDAPGIESVSGLGLMIGVTTEKPVSEVLAACMEKGVLCLSAKEKLRLLPPLNIPQEQLEKAIDIIIEVLSRTRKTDIF